jgi:hypothetical protein
MPRKLLMTIVVAGAGVGLATSVAFAAVEDDQRGRRDGMAEMHTQMGGMAGMPDGMAGMGGMAGMSEDMGWMHEAMDPAEMDAMHDRMVAEMPEELRERANSMHARMSAERGAMQQRHADHHPTDR